MNLRPLHDRIIVEPIEQEEQTSSGLFLPETAKEKPQHGKVIAAGPGAYNEEGDRIALDVQVGDVVLFGKYSGTEIKVAGKKYLIMKETDVFGIVE